jgi:hypothetical protein
MLSFSVVDFALLLLTTPDHMQRKRPEYFKSQICEKTQIKSYIPDARFLSRPTFFCGLLSPTIGKETLSWSNNKNENRNY